MDGKGAMHTNATNTSLSGDKIRDNKQQTTKNAMQCIFDGEKTEEKDALITSSASSLSY